MKQSLKPLQSMPPLNFVSSPVKCELQGFRRCLNLGREFLAESSMLLSRQRHTFDGDVFCEITSRPGISGPATPKSEDSDLDWPVSVESVGESEFLSEEHTRRVANPDSIGGKPDPSSVDGAS